MFPATPQARPSSPSVPCRTSTAVLPSSLSFLVILLSCSFPSRSLSLSLSLCLSLSLSLSLSVCLSEERKEGEMPILAASFRVSRPFLHPASLPLLPSISLVSRCLPRFIFLSVLPPNPVLRVLRAAFSRPVCATGSRPWGPPQDLPRTRPIAIEIVLKVRQTRAPVQKSGNPVL